MGELCQLAEEDNRGVSSVVGIVLLVGITVTIAGTVAVAVFGIGDLERIVELAQNVIDGNI